MPTTDNVIRIVSPEPDESIVQLLEALLERAKDGEIRAIAGVTMNTQAEFGEFTSLTVRESAIPFLAYLRVLQMRVEEWIEL